VGSGRRPCAFDAFSTTTRDERLALLHKIVEVYTSRLSEMADIISQEMGAPLLMAARTSRGRHRALHDRPHGRRLRVRARDGHDSDRA
jgi:hypothetical protein